MGESEEKKRNILDYWRVKFNELSQIIAENPSLRGFLFGYISEYKLRKLLRSDKRITNFIKYDDHDRSRKSDMVITYKGVPISIEVKSLQTRTVKRQGNGVSGKFQCDASDSREVTFPDGSKTTTTCLLVGDFDILAVNIFEFQGKWIFAFAKNRDLPKSQYKNYTEYQRKHLLATLMEITWPLKPPFITDIFHIFDEIVNERRKTNS